ncbi:MAG TPA: DnrO protein [Luteimonas sp.]
MKRFALLLVVAICAPGIAFAQHAHGAHDGHAMHGSHHPAAAAGETGAWTPDAPLIDGMARVSAAVASLAHMEMGHMAGAQVLSVADTIDAAVEDMFANCKLAPEPDAALHGILARLMAASKALRDAPADPAPAAVMRAALAEYARLFDDPRAAARR